MKSKLNTSTSRTSTHSKAFIEISKNYDESEKKRAEQEKEITRLKNLRRTLLDRLVEQDERIKELEKEVSRLNLGKDVLAKEVIRLRGEVERARKQGGSNYREDVTRERILELLKEGYSKKKIAVMLNVSVTTVNNRLANK